LPIVHPRGECVGAIVMMMLAGDKSWLIYQSSLAVLTAATSGARRNVRRNENFVYYLWYVNGSFKCHKILWHGTSSFPSHPKERVLQIFIAPKNLLPQVDFNPQPLGPMASTLTTEMTPRMDRWIVVDKFCGHSNHSIWDPWTFPFVTECRGWMINTLALNSGGHGLKSQSIDQGFLWFPSLHENVRIVS
jgi:hypothetical protein